MDLENELRQAMSDHVADVSAPATLAGDVRRRHRRRVRRQATVAGAVAVAAAVVMSGPVYQAVRPEPVSAPERTQPKPRTAEATPTASVTDTGSPSLFPKSSAPDQAGRPASGRSRHAKRGHQAAGAPSLLAYVPAGLRPVPCVTDERDGRKVTTCRWSGTGGWVEVRLVRGPGLANPSDLGFHLMMPRPARVHDRPSLRDDGQVMWIERGGLGVWVGVSTSLGDQLMRIASGVHP